MSDKIRHSGIVESIEDACVHVRIVQTSACAACQVASHCHAAESKEKRVDVYHADTAGLKAGDAVTVVASRQVAARALLWGFGLPLIVMLAVLLLTLRLTGQEGTAALAGLASLVPYYAVLWLMRGRLREQLTFTLE